MTLIALGDNAEVCMQTIIALGKVARRMIVFVFLIVFVSFPTVRTMVLGHNADCSPHDCFWLLSLFVCVFVLVLVFVFFLSSYLYLYLFLYL